MAYDNPYQYKEFQISATVHELPRENGRWQGSYIIQKDGEIVYRATNVARFENSHEAEQQAISLARRIIDGDVPGLKL
jgi:hypothetical protein